MFGKSFTQETVAAGAPPVHAVVEQGVLEEGKAALYGEALPHRRVMHLLDQAKQH
jgi:hypothetical protein